MKNHVRVNNKRCVAMKKSRQVGGDVPLLLSHIHKRPVQMGNGLPIANTSVGIASRSRAPLNFNVGPKPETGGGAILQTDPMKLLKNINFKGKTKKGKEKDTIKIVF